MTDRSGYPDWRSLELAIKVAAEKAARDAGPGISAATIDAQIRQARFDRFLSRVFADGEQSEWLLRSCMSSKGHLITKVSRPQRRPGAVV
ncbi:hypothetical protein [Nocardia sp. NPDC024068]|uniref:hypothetical protein n=1 Tax=Nocardia sp. NPDC024068 TaxID=3157197 RepID=UPI0033DD6B08